MPTCDDCPLIGHDELWIFCPRHKIKKSKPEVAHCHRRDKYWLEWERKREKRLKLQSKEQPTDEDAARSTVQPPLRSQAWNLVCSLAVFVADGCRTVTTEQYRERLEICDACEHRRRNRCMKCGCRLSLKAQAGPSSAPRASGRPSSVTKKSSRHAPP